MDLDNLLYCCNLSQYLCGYINAQKFSTPLVHFYTISLGINIIMVGWPINKTFKSIWKEAVVV
jgi:hypothetical protein